MCAAGFEGRQLDGVLAMETCAGADVRMVVYNADGSRPEACGDGLLCVAAHAAGERDGPVGVVTDSGARRVEVRSPTAEGRPARGSLGPARVVETDVELELGSTSVRATLVDVGNPHCVLFVDELSDALVAELGPALERHERFANGTNVELVETADDALRARVWERGVGETRACGTGACALAAAAVESGRATWPVRVDYPGGRLVVDRADDGEVWMEGTVRRLGEMEL
jgi:diaminopimelate epimerase